MAQLKNKRILVTGGAGFIGSHIVDRLLALGAQVAVLDNLISEKWKNIKHNLNKIKIYQKDICDESALKESSGGVEFVLHEAALRSVPKSVKDRLNITM